jgi:5'-nucleotidase
VTVNGAQIGIFSLLTDAMELYPPDFREDVITEPFIDVARRTVAELQAQGVDMIILLSHLGHTDDVSVAQAVRGIDIIIGGHTHTPLWEMHIVNGTPIVRALVNSPVIGRIIVNIQPASSPRIVDYRLVELTDRFRSDPTAKNMVLKWQRELPPEEVVGRLANPIDTRGVTKNFGESAAGNLYVDALLGYFADEVDIALVHMGTVRGERIFPAGDFTNHDLAEYHPFDNPPILMDLTAPELKFMLERGVHEFPAGRGYFLSVAGLSLTIDTDRQPQIIDRDNAVVLTPGERIVSAEFDGHPVDFTDESRVFRAVLDGYVGRGGSGFFMAKTAANIRQSDEGGHTMLRWYFNQHDEVDCRVDGRITMVQQ